MASPAVGLGLIRKVTLHIIVRLDCGINIPCHSNSSDMDIDHWCRFVIKQTFEKLRPKRSFVRYNSAPKNLDLEEGSLLHPQVPIHGPRSIQHGWEWYEMGFFVHWTPPHSTTILCFDLPEPLQASIQSALTSSVDKTEFSDPYSVFSVLLDEILSLYNTSVWSLRNHICAAEAVGLQFVSCVL